MAIRKSSQPMSSRGFCLSRPWLGGKLNDQKVVLGISPFESTENVEIRNYHQLCFGKSIESSCMDKNAHHKIVNWAALAEKVNTIIDRAYQPQ
ncbi:MAG: hypothetical protein D3926_15935 [Desulfobacteraceae bacterium]|nr:MAG: hypothetical protein D3926_15935 [Desulfobacteraceae bacterium]